MIARFCIGPRALLALSLLIGAVDLAWAQTGSMSIAGTVQDSSSLPLPGATVTVLNEITQSTRATITNSAGLYEIPFLASSRYTVRAEYPGFATSVSKGILLEIHPIARLDFQLKPASIATEVEVEANSLPLTFDSPVAGRSISRKEIEAVPLAGRDFASLQILSPGVQPANNVGGFAGRELSEGFRVAGGTMYTGSFSVELADNNRTYYFGNATSPSLEIIQKVHIQTAPGSSDYRAGPYEVDVSLRGGGDRYHGSLFEYLQHDWMNAGNAMSGASPSHFRRSQYGGSISGPLRKNRLFLFAVYEGILQRGGEPSSVQVATPDQRNGIFPLTGGDAVTIKDPLTGKPFAGNQVPQSRFSPMARYFLDNVWPMPNWGTQIYRENSIPMVDSDQFHVKTDFIRDRSNDFSLHVSRQKLTFKEDISKWLLSPRKDRFDNLLCSLRYTRIFGAGMVNSLLLAARRDTNTGSPVSDAVEGGSFAERIGMTLGGPTGSGFPLIQISGKGFSGRTGQLNVPTEHSGDTLQLQDTLQWMTGRHRLSLGFEIKRFQNQERDDGSSVGQFSFNGRYSGSGLADFYLGFPNQVSYGPELGRLYLSNTLWSTYVQDAWRIRDNLTLNLGLRYEYLSWPTERYDRMATADPQAGMRLIVSSADNVLPSRMAPVAVASFPAGTFISNRQAGLPRSLRFPDRNNFAPHIGVAYRLGADMVLRGGYGIDYVKNSQAVFNDREATFGLPFRISRVVTNPNPSAFNILNPFAAFAPSVRNTIDSAWYIDPNFRLAYVQTWSFHIERRMPFSSVLEVGYVGNRMVHGKQTWNWNQSTTWPNRNNRFSGYTNILALTSGADSRYNSLQAVLRRQVVRGLQGQVNYTWSKTLSNAVADGEPNSIWVHDPAMQWGRGRWDRSHVITGSFTYEIPLGRNRWWPRFLPGMLDEIVGGWQLAGMVRYLSGKPLTITSSLAKANLNVQGYVPADRLAEGRLQKPNSGRWFDQSAFTTPPADRPGNAGYGVLDGPGFIAEDIALYKNFRIREAARVQLRLEVYNALNHTNLGDPITDVDNWSLMGKILTSGSALRGQVALRIDF